MNNACHGFKTPVEAIEDVKKKNRYFFFFFFEVNPKTYKDLAEAISYYALVWTSIENNEVHADEEIVKQLVSSFIKTLAQ